MPKQAVAQTITPIPPRLPRSISANTRKLVEKAVEAHQAAMEGLIDFLDAADGDVELEDGADDEPSLGGIETPSGTDCEGDPCDQGEPDACDERWFQPARLDVLPRKPHYFEEPARGKSHNIGASPLFPRTAQGR